MSLPRTDTGETAKPLAQLQELTEQKQTDLETNLLKEALAISNNRCNTLIRLQNVLISDLTSKVESVEQKNDRNTETISSQLNRYKAELHELILDERKFTEKVSREIAEAIRGAANEVTAYAKAEMDKSTEEVKRQLAECAKEIEKQRKQTILHGWFRKFLFWATPILLVAQTIAIIVSML